MKKIIIIILVVFSVSQSFGQRKKKTELKTFNDSVSYALGMDIGRAMKNQNVTELNSDLIKKGFDVIIADKNILFSEDTTKQILQKFFGEKQKRMQEKEKKENEVKYAENLKTGSDFLAKNAKEEGVITTKSGLQYKIIKAGDGAMPTKDSKVKTHYKGTLIDGTTFDSSYERGEPITFPVSGVIPGWTEALQLMKVGAKWELYIPQELAYGDRDMGKIKPYSTLIFVVELLEIEPPE